MTTRFMKAATLLAALLSIAVGSAAQDAIDIAPDDDAVTEAALRAAMTGDTEEVILLARMRERVEQQAIEEERNIWILSDNIAALGAAASRPLKNRAETRDILKGFRADAESDNIMRLLTQIEPREHFLVTVDDRRYEQRRRVFNSVAGSIAGVLQLQLFSLIQPPLDLLDHLFVGRNYLAPEQRRELRAAREVEAAGIAMTDAMVSEKDLSPRRRALAALQARRNGAACADQERYEIADWWYRREMDLQEKDEPFREEHEEVLAQIKRRETLMAGSVNVADGDAALQEPSQFAAYSLLLRTFTTNPGDPGLPEMARQFRAQFPRSPAYDDTIVLEIIQANASGRRDLGGIIMRDLAANQKSSWGRALAEYLQLPDFDPDASFRAADEAIAQRRNRFLLTGVDPRIHRRQLSPEDARLIESGWITAARSLFIFDTLTRALALPLLPSSTFPKDELYDAVETAPREYLLTAKGQKRLEQAARAKAGDKRFSESAALWERAGNKSRAAAMREKASRNLEKLGDAAAAPEDRADAYRRLLASNPRYENRARIERKLARATEEISVLHQVTRRELLAWRNLWEDNGLFLNAGLFDNWLGNGEVSEDGVFLLAGDQVTYFDLGPETWITQPVDTTTMDQVQNMLYPLRRTMSVREELGRALPRKRIPLALEGSAMPGVDIAPALVPLDLDERERRLYE